ncbi:translation initiation factor IF-2-like [Cricetulus griseus]|uniref:Translation initiation factor IF-2-like n=1 Tax=Cricetulus griseus TaxID=10029 RepID=A0A9J7GC42_CRIGR|nr:translation initiation factor IF-2-like [Cricetulus griseus]
MNAMQKEPRCKAPRGGDGTRTSWSKAATRKPKGSQETGVTILQTPDTRPFQPPRTTKSAARKREGSPHGAAELERHKARWLTAAARFQLGLAEDRGTWPRRRPRPAPARPPPRLPAQPRPPPSPARVRVRRRRVPWGGAAPPQPDGSGEQSGGGGANFFRCLLRAPSGDYLQRRAQSLWRKSTRASVRVPVPEQELSEASRTSQDPARPLARAPSSRSPSLPSRLQAGGRGAGARGRGRAGPAGSCSSPPRRGGSGCLGEGGDDPEARRPCQVPRGASSAQPPGW